MEKNTFVVNIGAKTVTLCHETQTLDGSVLFETTFDMSAVPMSRLLKRTADADVISWRARVGIKKLTTAEVLAKNLVKTIVDSSKSVERVKHVETEEEKKIRAAVVAIMSGKGGDAASIRELMDKANALLRAREEAEMEAGESTEAEESEDLEDELAKELKGAIEDKK